jgi:hypothetical protein
MKAVFSAILLLQLNCASGIDGGCRQSIWTRPDGHGQSNALIAARNDGQSSQEASNSQDKNAIEIINSGSTNTAGFRINVERTGKSTWSLTGALAGKRYSQAGSTSGGGNLEAKLAKQLFDDIDAAMPLSQYPSKGCAKSRSFGYVVTMKYCAEQSPDLSCPMQEEKLIRLKTDLDEVLKTLHLGLSEPRRAMD